MIFCFQIFKQLNLFFFNDAHNILAVNYVAGGFKIWDVNNKKILHCSKDQNAHCSFSQSNDQVVICSGSKIRIQSVFSMLLVSAFNQLPLSQQFFMWSLFKNKAPMNFEDIKAYEFASIVPTLGRGKKNCLSLFNELPESVQDLCFKL